MKRKYTNREYVAEATVRVMVPVEANVVVRFAGKRGALRSSLAKQIKEYLQNGQGNAGPSFGTGYDTEIEVRITDVDGRSPYGDEPNLEEAVQDALPGTGKVTGKVKVRKGLLIIDRAKRSR